MYSNNFINGGQVTLVYSSFEVDQFSSVHLFGFLESIKYYFISKNLKVFGNSAI